MKTKIFSVFGLLVCALQLHSQSVYLIRFSGTVMVNDIELPSNYKFLLDSNDKVVFEKNARALVLSRSKQLTLVSPGKVSTNMAKLLGQLNRQPENVAFWNYIKDVYGTIAMGEQSKGSVKAGIKGLNDGKFNAGTQQEFDEFSPGDSAMVLVTKPLLQWRTVKKMLYPTLLVYHIPTHDTIYHEKADTNGSVQILLPKAGYYRWILYSKADKKNQITRTFQKVTPAQVAEADNELARLKKQTAGWDPGLRDQLLADYLRRHQIVRP